MTLIFFMFLTLSSILPTSANAYLDPGTGSYVFQLLIAFMVGIAFSVKIYWVKIKLFFARVFGKKKNTSDTAPDSLEKPAEDEK